MFCSPTLIAIYCSIYFTIIFPEIPTVQKPWNVLLEIPLLLPVWSALWLGLKLEMLFLHILDWLFPSSSSLVDRKMAKLAMQVTLTLPKAKSGLYTPQLCCLLLFRTAELFCISKLQFIILALNLNSYQSSFNIIWCSFVPQNANIVQNIFPPLEKCKI